VYDVSILTVPVTGNCCAAWCRTGASSHDTIKKRAARTSGAIFIIGEFLGSLFLYAKLMRGKAKRFIAANNSLMMAGNYRSGGARSEFR
jgi:hypothetical protein